MRIITISREFGSGGRELGKRMADLLEFDYYDSEIVSAVARESGLDTSYVARMLQNHGWRNLPISFRGTLGSADNLQSGQVSLLLKQKKVIEQIAAMGKDCIIVGRNADVLLQSYQPFNLFVCATREAKLRRCLTQAPEGESFSEKELLRKMKQIDKTRSQTREILTGSAWGQRDAYHMIINTTDWEIKKLAPVVADCAGHWFGRNA